MAYPSKISTRRLIIRYKGIFDFDALYNLMVRWFKAAGYWFHETDFKHKVLPGGVEDEIKWSSERKVNDYIKYYIDIFTHTWDLTEIEVVRDGEKKKLNSGRIEITFDASVEIDYQKRLQQRKIWAAIADVYYKYFLKEDIETIHHDTLYYRMQKFHSIVKEFLDMGAKGYEYKGYLGENG